VGARGVGGSGGWAHSDLCFWCTRACFLLGRRFLVEWTRECIRPLHSFVRPVCPKHKTPSFLAENFGSPFGAPRLPPPPRLVPFFRASSHPVFLGSVFWLPREPEQMFFPFSASCCFFTFFCTFNFFPSFPPPPF